MARIEQLNAVLDELRTLSESVTSDEEARELSSKIAQASRALRIETSFKCKHPSKYICH